MQVGEREAFPLLRHLCQQQLRDATRPTLEPVIELLHLLLPILLQVGWPGWVWWVGYKVGSEAGLGCCQ